MVGLMVESTLLMLRTWEDKIDMEAELGGSVDRRVDQCLLNLTADIIAKTSFGSSFSQGKEIFAKLQTLQSVMSLISIFVGIPGLGYQTILHKIFVMLLVQVIGAIWILDGTFLGIFPPKEPMCLEVGKGGPCDVVRRRQTANCYGRW